MAELGESHFVKIGTTPVEDESMVSVSKWGMFPKHEPEVVAAKRRFERMTARGFMVDVKV